ncbi:MAG: CDP-alcohol phosphatidyltransferase family protein, partial [Myxococcales bacterium]
AAFAIAAFTDLFDGLLARLLDQRSKLGAILDPLADKALALAAIVAMTLNHRLPLWFLGIALARDAVVLIVAAVARLRGVRLTPRPSRIGKSATFFANAAVIIALIHQIAYAPWLSPYVVALILIAGECMAAAALQYLVRFGPVVWRVPVPRTSQGA